MTLFFLCLSVGLLCLLIGYILGKLQENSYFRSRIRAIEALWETLIDQQAKDINKYESERLLDRAHEIRIRSKQLASCLHQLHDASD